MVALNFIFWEASVLFSTEAAPLCLVSNSIGGFPFLYSLQLLLCSFLLLEGHCFTILCWFLPYINVIQPHGYICPLPPEPRPPSLTPSYPFRWSWSRSPWTTQQILTYCFTYGDIFVHTILSIVPRPLPSLCPQVCSLCLHLTNRFIITIVLDFIHMC